MKKILIIEDNKILRGMISNYLNNHGFYTEETSNVEIAESLIEHHNFNIIILDDALGNIRGRDFCKKIRKKYPSLFIIGISGSCEEKDFINSGADAFLGKPFFLKELLKIIENYEV